MKRATIVCVAVLGVGLAASAARAVPVQVVSEDPGWQDPLKVTGLVHELGCLNVFPEGEQIQCFEWWETTKTACPEEPGDDPTIPNVVVQIINVGRVAYDELYYVADPETQLTNVDGLVGVAGDEIMTPAFRIDHDGVNQPLQFESMAWDNVFEPGEVWNFIIQDYTNALQGPPLALNSIGVAGQSGGVPPSTGSIITPEPATLALVGLGLAALAARRRR